MTTKIPVELSSTPGIVDNSDATAITIDSSERVMIGTTDAGYPDYGDSLTLGDVDGGGGNAGMTIRSGTGSYGTFYFSDATGTAAGTYAGKMQYNHSTNSMVFATNSSDRLTIDSSGNVGVGTTSPNAKLHVATSNSTTFSASNSSWHTQVIKNDTGAESNASGLAFFTSANGYHVNAGTGIACVKNGTNSDYGSHLVFITRPQSAVAAERMRIDDTGNLLIGTTSSSIGTGVGVKIRTDSSTAPYMGIVLNTASAAHGNYMHYNLNSTYNGYRFYVFNNGGIANYSANNSNLSDERVKSNIELSGNYLQKICDIPVKLFNYKDEPEDKERSLGVIAQDVEAVAPELVNNEGFGDTPEDGVPLKTVYTTDMMYALMKAIQEQQAIIEDLQTQINEVKNGN